MTIEQLKIKSNNWFKLFNLISVLAAISIAAGLIWKELEFIFYIFVAGQIIIATRMKKWNNTYCDQRDEEYYQNKKDEILKRLETNV